MNGLEHVVNEWWTGWVRRGRTAHALRSEAGWVLRATARERWTALSVFVAFTALFAWAFAAGGAEAAAEPAWRRIGETVLALAICLVAALATASSWLERVTVGDAGVARRALRGSARMSWPALSRVDVRSHDEGITLVGRDGVVLQVSSSLDGLPVLLEYLQKYASNDNALVARVGLRH
jgi:4-amino-4-deoxy-L-arabinose transferase-like glycosyltransferase